MVKRMRIVSGVNFPTDEKSGKRSTQSFGRKCIAQAVGSVDQAASQAAGTEKNWRWGYDKHFVKMVKLGCAGSDDALKIAQAGLKYAHDTFEFVRDGECMSLGTAMDKFKKDVYYTARVSGSASPSFSMPYEGKDLTGDDLKAQIDRWVTKGVIEPDAGAAVKNFLNQKLTDNTALFDNHYFCMLGAGSAMGPFELLMRLGATVVAVDLNRPHIWERLVGTAKKFAGTLIFPIDKPRDEIPTDFALYRSAGTDLITKTPEIANWLANPEFQDRKLVIGAYAYLNGDLFVRVSIAMDAIISGVIDRLKSQRKPLPALAYLNTPTNIHLVTQEAYDAANTQNRNAPAWQKLISMFGKCVSNVEIKPITSKEGTNLCVQNHLSPTQGPNYALAKRFQIWRALLAREEGCLVSTHVAPSTATVSVTQNKAIALAYKGFPMFNPLEVFEQNTTNALMTAVLLNDLTDKNVPANPAKKLDHPMLLHAGLACHGGAQRMAFTMGTIGEAAAGAYVLTHPVSLLIYAFLTAVFFTFFVL